MARAQREHGHAKAAIIGRAGADQLFIVHLADKQRVEANTIDRVGCGWWVARYREGEWKRRGGGTRAMLLPRHEIVVYSKCHACLISQNYGSSCSSFNGSSVATRSLRPPSLFIPRLAPSFFSSCYPFSLSLSLSLSRFSRLYRARGSISNVYRNFLLIWNILKFSVIYRDVTRHEYRARNKSKNIRRDRQIFNCVQLYDVCHFRRDDSQLLIVSMTLFI